MPKDEEAAYRDRAEQRFAEQRAKEFKIDIENAKKTVHFLNDVDLFSKEEITAKMHTPPTIIVGKLNCQEYQFGNDGDKCIADKRIDRVKYYNPYHQVQYCHEQITKWRDLYKEHLPIKKAVLEKYKDQLATRTYWDPGEKTATQAYVDRVSKYDFNASNENLIKLLRERDPEDLEVTRDNFSEETIYVNEIGELKHCQQLMEIVLPSIIKYSYDYDQTEIKRKGYAIYKVSYEYMKQVANDLFIDEAQQMILNLDKLSKNKKITQDINTENIK